MDRPTEEDGRQSHSLRKRMRGGIDTGRLALMANSQLSSWTDGAARTAILDFGRVLSLNGPTSAEAVVFELRLGISPISSRDETGHGDGHGSHAFCRTGREPASRFRNNRP